MFPLTVAHISAKNLRNNLRTIRQAVGAGVQIWPAVKANAYGHGLRIVLDILAEPQEAAGVSVANLEEAIYVRQQNWNRGVLILGPDVNVGMAAVRRAKLLACLDYDVEPNLTEQAVAEELAALARQRGEKGVAVHIKLDSGMNRLGLSSEEVIRLARFVRGQEELRLASIFTHLAVADEEDPEAEQITRAQFAVYARTCAAIEADGRGPVFMHAANSAGLMRFPEGHFAAVRPGICLYGLSPFASGNWEDWPRPGSKTTDQGRPPTRNAAPEGDAPRALFTPVMSVRSHIVLVKRVPAGSGVGYGHAWKAPRDSVLGVVPIGYNDGYRRSWGGRAVMRVDGVYCPVVGRISMDSAILDLTAAPNPRVDMAVEIISSDPNAANSVTALARLDGTIPYEITCLMGARIHRVAVEE